MWSERAFWHTMSADAVCSHLQSTPNGLSQAEAERRLKAFGANELQAARRLSPWRLLIEQFKSALIIMLLVAALLSSFLGHATEAIATGIIVCFAALLGFAQEYRAERAIQALQRLAATHTRVLRDGVEREISSKDVVPGDVIFLSAGDRVPADGRLLQAINLNVDEAALTGESSAVAKHNLEIPGEQTAIADRTNMVYAGTAASFGRGRAIVVGTGMDTEFGRIATLLETVEAPKTHLQQTLDRLGSILARVALAVVALVAVAGLIRHQPLVEVLIFGLALAVAVVPEALPAVVTISMAIGVQRMAQRHALMRRLAAVEALGSTTIICSDKTGTLTKDEMTVRKIIVSSQVIDVTGSGYAPHGQFLLNGTAITASAELVELLTAAALASDASIIHNGNDGTCHINGDPTEAAMVVAAHKAGLSKYALEQEFPRVDEIPFSSERKRMTTLHQINGRLIAYSKGAPEVIVASCRLNEAARKAILLDARRMAAEGLRVLAVAYKPDGSRQTLENEMTFLGLLGMLDAPRPEAKRAVATCQHAGIRVVMITGDHPLTAEAIARELGILKSGRVVTATELESMSDAELTRDVENIEVYARVSPADKLRVVEALQRNRHVVAMTGDGVNDAPALKKSDVGIAMGITGTDVTKEAAAMTLLDDNFASIVAAVEEGRIIFSNIRKYLGYLLASNLGEIGLIAASTLAGIPLPLSAVQILYINLATDGLPALALAVDPPESDLMQRRPLALGGPLFPPSLVWLMGVGGIWSTMVNFSLFFWMLKSGRPLSEAMTVTFVALVLIEFFKAYNFRSDRRSILNHPFGNKWLNTAVLWEVALLIVMVYVPWPQKFLGTFSLPAADWVLAVVTAISICPILDLVKNLVSRTDR